MSADQPARGHTVEQTPAHEHHNPELLQLMPERSRRVVEVGCSSGALAREYKKVNPGCHYIGIEVVSAYVPLARRHCDEVHELDIERVDDAFLRDSLAGDCWVFGDTLEHLNDPWSLLARIRRIMPADGSIVACIPNAQHWSVQARLVCGEFRYEESGLLDRSHLRWFTRITITEMFSQAGFTIVGGLVRTVDGPGRELVLPAIRLMAQNIGRNPDLAAQDALAFQYVLRAVPG
jgi:SAM-dependent methyltransferase